MNRIRNLHVGQLVILGVVMGVMGVGLVMAGYMALDRLDEAQRELRRAEMGDPYADIWERPTQETHDAIDPEQQRLEEARERRIREAEVRVARARAQVITLFGAAVLVLLGYLAVAWVWFGARSESANRPKADPPPGPP